MESNKSKKEKQHLKDGTGRSFHSLDRDSQKVSIDFSGEASEEGKSVCYRNDASIVFFAANSYRTSNYILRDEIKRRFESNCKPKDIGHLIMPYFFSFRHSIELYLKALIIAITGVSPDNKHDLRCLTESLNNAIQQCEKPSESLLSDQLFNEKKNIVISLFQDLAKMIRHYSKQEPSEDYYRYLFGLSREKDFQLSTPNLTLDYPKISNAFNDAFLKIFQLCHALREADIYVYYTL